VVVHVHTNTIRGGKRSILLLKIKCVKPTRGKQL